MEIDVAMDDASLESVVSITKGDRRGHDILAAIENASTVV
jgi:hypothetical protein